MSLLEQLEAVNPQPDPVDHLDQVEGDWKLLFSTISIKVWIIVTASCMQQCVWMITGL